MERKRIEKLVALLLVGILIPVSLFPFRINADTITNSNVNINYYLDSVTEVSTGNYLQTYKVDFIFDQSYLGWISSKMVGTYVNNNTIPTTTSQFSITKAIYVNGSIASTSISFTTPNTISNGALQSLSQSIQNSNVTPLSDLSTLDDILNVLNDINNNVEIDILDELQNIVTNSSLANDYLDNISKFRQYRFPIESFSFVNEYMSRSDKQLIDLYDNGDYTFPVFTSSNDYVYQFNYGQYVMIFGINKAIYGINSFNNVFDLINAQLDKVEYIQLGRTYYNNVLEDYYIVKVYITRTASGSYIRFKNYSDIRIMPIYASTVEYSKYVSIDFALRFGLSNQLLDNIQIIANGTNQSSSASGSLDQTTSQFSDDANDLVTIEESFNNSMNQSLQSVNPTFNMGSSFLTSANWVSQQFNRIVNNTPFASLITFGLTLGLGLLIIGKVRK